MTENTGPDIERLAESAATAIEAIEQLMRSPSFDVVDRKTLGDVRDYVIEQAAATARLAASGTDMDAVLFGSPAVLEAAIRHRLTLGQVAQLVALLEP